MPIYEYRCPEGHQYERWEGFEAPREHACPHCGGTSRRLLSIPAVIFKGPGFYSTDYRKDGRHPEGAGDSKVPAKGGSAAGGSEPSAASESPESKSETSV